LEDYRSWKPEGAGPDDYVFQRDGKPMDDRRLLRMELGPVAKRLGIHFPGFGWHTFRRQNITLIQEEGATPLKAQAQARHSKPMMTSAYTLIGLDRREKAVRKFEKCNSVCSRRPVERLSGSNAGIVRDFEVVE